MIQAMRDLERTWNHKFNYPWTFFNDEPFDENFKRKTRAETNAECHYGITSSYSPYHNFLDMS
jgi:mannosyltransferase